jgi:hypothetical protein
MIKKVLSILSTVLMLTAMLHFSVATHYCRGMIASSKVSLSGELATCGMEKGDIQQPLSGLIYSSHCCDNDIRYYGVCGNYFPSIAIIPAHFQQLIQTFDIPVDLVTSTFCSLTVSLSENPPGMANQNQVHLSEICTFRI